MERTEAMDRLKFLYDQVHQTAERIEHLPASLPLDVHPESLNYENDLVRIKGEYNRLASAMHAQGLVTPDELDSAGLPAQWERKK